MQFLFQKRLTMRAAILVLSALGLALSACSQRKPTPATVQAEPVEHPCGTVVHQVRYSGETLSHIALWYTGKAGNWEKLLRENGDLNPNRIQLGQRILVPPRILLRCAPPANAFAQLRKNSGSRAMLGRKPTSVDAPREDFEFRVPRSVVKAATETTVVGAASTAIQTVDPLLEVLATQVDTGLSDNEAGKSAAPN